jgi:prophage tail gpP-like protein
MNGRFGDNYYGSFEVALIADVSVFLGGRSHSGWASPDINSFMGMLS